MNTKKISAAIVATALLANMALFAVASAQTEGEGSGSVEVTAGSTFQFVGGHAQSLDFTTVAFSDVSGDTDGVERTISFTGVADGSETAKGDKLGWQDDRGVLSNTYAIKLDITDFVKDGDLSNDEDEETHFEASESEITVLAGGLADSSGATNTNCVSQGQNLWAFAGASAAIAGSVHEKNLVEVDSGEAYPVLCDLSWKFVTVIPMDQPVNTYQSTFTFQLI